MESNHRRPALQAGALPLSYQGCGGDPISGRAGPLLTGGCRTPSITIDGVFGLSPPVLADEAGIEPATAGLTIRCSTAELLTIVTQEPSFLQRNPLSLEPGVPAGVPTARPRTVGYVVRQLLVAGRVRPLVRWSTVEECRLVPAIDPTGPGLHPLLIPATPGSLGLSLFHAILQFPRVLPA